MNTAHHFPVEAVYRPESLGGWESTSLAWSDYGRMHTYERKLFSNRQIEPPEWALNDGLFRRLLVRYLENRAGYRHPQPGSDSERLARAQAAIDASMAGRAATLKRLCEQCVALKKSVPVDEKRLRRLEQDIECADTTIIANRNVALLATAVVYRYYRIGEDSVGVSQALGIKPPHVRQILWRLRREWERLQRPQVVKVTNPHYIVDAARAAQLRAQGLTYAAIGKELGSSNVVAALKHAGLWIPVPSPLDRAKAAIKKAEATLARLYVKHSKERPLVIPRKRSGKYPMTFRGPLKKHVAIFEKIVRENGGQLPSYRWMNESGFFTTYMYIRKYPDAFRHLAP